ncbi:hypothetical protein PMAYCL1PPCAC_17997, partial [Pristionchus mayeri]
PLFFQFSMLLRLLSVTAILGVINAANVNPCAGKPAFQCEDDISSCLLVFPLGAGGVPNDKCFDPKDGDFPMTTFCRSTCQLCCQEPQHDCEDDPIPGMDCPGDIDGCNQFSDINFDHCKSSCGWCELTSKPCVDMSPSADCQKMKDANLCTNAEVSVQCEKTCGVCIVPDCEDASARCSIWVANGFCIDEFYKNDKASYCKKSCDLC